MNAKHQASVGGKSSLPSGPATTQLRPGQVGTSAAVEVLPRCWATVLRKNRARYMYCGLLLCTTENDCVLRNSTGYYCVLLTSASPYPEFP